MAIIAGRLGSMTISDAGGALGWSGAVQNWRLSETIELPDTTVLGDTDDSHILGLLSATASMEVLYDSADDITEIQPGTVVTAIVLLFVTGGENVSGAGTIQSVGYNADRRGAQLLNIVVKSKGAWVWADA